MTAKSRTAAFWGLPWVSDLGDGTADVLRPIRGSGEYGLCARLTTEPGYGSTYHQVHNLAGDEIGRVRRDRHGKWEAVAYVGEAYFLRGQHDAIEAALLAVLDGGDVAC